MQGRRMKWLLVGFLLVALLADSTFAKRRKHHKNPKLLASTEEEIAENLEKVEENLETSEEEEQHPVVEQREDPCLTKHCGPGQVCTLDELGEAFCKCIDDCPVEEEPRRKVCSNHNETWGSDCELYRMRCLCKREDSRCSAVEAAVVDSYKHMHIEYYGECREIEECTTGQMADFPRRMREWLFNIMRDMAERDELSPHYLKLEREAETNLTRRWTNAVIWKWCDLDSTQDRAVSRHELFPIRAPLVSMEHCIAPFLNSCDANGDHLIHLREWIKCMEIEEEDIEEKCEDIREDVAS